MTVSTTGSANNGLVYLTMIGHDTAGHTTITQASGVLLSNDEVLTAAHVVYNDDGSLRTAGVASVGYNKGSSVATATVDGAQALAKQDYTTVAGIGSDFAVVHLKTPVTNGTIFALGSDLTSGSFSVSGYPLGTAGTLDTKTEQLSLASGTHIYAGETLHDGTGNPEGSSGGSVYQIIDGQPTAFGVISADLSSDTTKGFFKQLTAADVSQIQAWVNGADAGASKAPAVAAAVAAVPAVQATSQALSAALAPTASSDAVPGLSQDAASALTDAAAFITGRQQAVMSDVAAAIGHVSTETGTAADLTQAAADYIKGNSSFAKRAVAYLAGFLSGASGSSTGDIASGANGVIDGAVGGSATQKAAAAGHAEALLMGYSNTSATVDAGSAALINVLSSPGEATADATAPHVPQGASHAHHVLTAHLQP